MYSLGLDFGSTAVRALIIDLERGIQTAAAGADYPCGVRGVCLREDDPRLARQEPDAYLAAMTQSILEAEALARTADPGFSPELVAGIGVDATSSTIMPVTQDLVPLSRLAEFSGDQNALSWMWKDHTSFDESREITELARQLHPEYLTRCGGTYSSEWFWSKTLHALRAAPRVFDAAYAWIELCDFIPAVLRVYQLVVGAAGENGALHARSFEGPAHDGNDHTGAVRSLPYRVGTFAVDPKFTDIFEGRTLGQAVLLHRRLCKGTKRREQHDNGQKEQSFHNSVPI